MPMTSVTAMRQANWCAIVSIICTACGLPTADEGALGTPQPSGAPEPPAIPYEEVVWPWQTGFFGDHMERSHAINQLTSRAGSWCYFIARSAVQRSGDEGGIRRRFSFHPVLATRQGVHPSQRPSGPDLIEHIQLDEPQQQGELAFLPFTPVDASFIRPLAEIQSLRRLVLGPVEGGPRREVLAPLRQLPDYRRVVRGEFIAEEEAQERP